MGRNGGREVGQNFVIGNFTPMRRMKEFERPNDRSGCKDLCVVNGLWPMSVNKKSGVDKKEGEGDPFEHGPAKNANG